MMRSALPQFSVLPPNSSSPLSVYTIPSSVPFLESLALGLLQAYPDPFQMAQGVIFLPYRRAVQVLRHFLLKHARSSGLMLPRILSLGESDVFSSNLSESAVFSDNASGEEDFSDQRIALDRPVIGPFVRRALLLRLVHQYHLSLAKETRPPLITAVHLTQELIALLDQAAIEEVPLENLDDLVADNFQEHFKLTLDFFRVILSHWPQILGEQGVQDPYTAHHAHTDEMIKAWTASPPQGWVIAAGSTGTMPATARLLGMIASLERGSIILPGLDQDMEEGGTLPPTHPQYAMMRLLKRLELKPQAVSTWPFLLDDFCTYQARQTLFQDLFRGDGTIQSTQGAREALETVRYIPCHSVREEALVIALILREALEIKNQTAVLITPDRNLAQRVTAELERWGIAIADSSGSSLRETDQGRFALLILQAVLEDMAPVTLLALLKHPFSPGYEDDKSRSLLEKRILRGVKPSPGFAGITTLLDQKTPETREILLPYLEVIRTWLAPLMDLVNQGQSTPLAFEAMLEAHCAVCCGKNGEGDDQANPSLAAKTWQTFYEKLREAGKYFPDMTLQDYFFLVQEWMGQENLVSFEHTHPRLNILGSLEGRLVQGDVTILGGLNEGTWPPESRADPWLNRQMREELGFPSPERRIGLSSHDFGQAFSHGRVYMTRATRVGSTPTIPSRLMTRLTSSLAALGMTLPIEDKWRSWARVLMYGGEEQQGTQLAPPCPCPPVAARPRALSVTHVEMWRRDPYAFYARHILKLLPLPPLEQEPDAALRGTLIHGVIERFLNDPDLDIESPKAFEALMHLGEEIFGSLLERMNVRSFWWPRFKRLALWFLETERIRRRHQAPYRVISESAGQLTFPTKGGEFTLRARADRIDVFDHGGVALIDYKTGHVPSEKDVVLGFSPQLPLEALILEHKGFYIPSSTSFRVREMSFWQLSGRGQGGQVIPISESLAGLLDTTFSGFKRWIEAFEDPEKPYLCMPFPDKAPFYNDYAHLARLQAWEEAA